MAGRQSEKSEHNVLTQEENYSDGAYVTELFEMPSSENWKHCHPIRPVNQGEWPNFSRGSIGIFGLCGVMTVLAQ